MGRGPKFSFPIPGRKSRKKVEADSPLDDTRSIPSIQSTSEWPPRTEDSSSLSKAHRLLGAVPVPSSSKSQSSVPQSPGYMTITVSEASFGSEYTDKLSSTAVDDGAFYPAKRTGMVSRSSSNVLGQTYRDDGRRASNCSSMMSRRLHPQTSNSTMRSYYDPQKSPLSVSQQTSDSAVRDMALRKGMTPVSSNTNLPLTASRPSRSTADEVKRQARKPARLDLSKLFPKPRTAGGIERAEPLLSPSKLVNSPSAMSTASEFFPRPMTREPTPTPNMKGHAKLTKTPRRQQKDPSHHQRPTSPVRMQKRDTYDNAKINVRRPPRGIQHWFEGLDEESEDDTDDEPTPVHAPAPMKPNGTILAPTRKSSLGRIMQDHNASSSRQPTYANPMSSQDYLVFPNPLQCHQLNSPSQFSIQTQESNKTKDSTFSRANLQDSSVLSISSSESESEGEERRRKNKIDVRKSLDVGEDHGEIIIGRAQAFDVRPRPPHRTQSAGKISMMSTSTNAATIEVMYTPEPYTTSFPFTSRHSGYGSRRSSQWSSQDRKSGHYRQPSTIHEDDPKRPKTSGERPLSPSSTSMASAQSEPRLASDQHKLMAVTAEEEALLEMMRRKRAAMAKHSFSEGFKTAMLVEEARQLTPPELRSPRTSAFLTMDSPSLSPARRNTASSRKSVANTMTPLLLPVPTRGRPTNAPDLSGAGTSMLRDSSSCDPDRTDASFSASETSSNRYAHLAPHLLSPPPEFSPLDASFASQTPTTASIASPATTDHASPLPSPVTPGFRTGDSELYVNVKVAGSEPSYDGERDDDTMPVVETGIIVPPSGSIKPTSPSTLPAHQRRRTASSGADVAFTPRAKPSPLPLKSSTPESYDLAPVSETSPAALALPKLPRKSSRRVNTLTVSTADGPARTRRSEHRTSRGGSDGSMTSAPDRRSRITSGSGSHVSRGSNSNSRQRDSVNIGSASTRCSVSEDVLAAWGSLGGLRDYDYRRVGGM
ncbi:hypothetical protein EJ04DRAFT_508506 [Polyplosphaeria fusca]|uniref:Uncharacterized protein n=1 Tax=Polyplosphaeria fusca TaxID=682080 RepID=A0A9P4V7U1_9PLEO|nr:hypothetical protein EJ04DRAFT_508506 [Polyplosphaeria fusca]